MKLKTVDKKVVSLQDWDELVQETYGKVYSFQQQEDCKGRGIHNLNVPSEYTDDEEMFDSIPEVINGREMGVKFDVWLKRDPNEPLNPSKKELKECNYYWGKTEEDEIEWKNSKSNINLFWERNFYPDVQTIANDLYSKGLLDAGQYIINIDW